MKTNKLFLLSMILGISYGLFAQTQNGVWSLAPKYAKSTSLGFQSIISLPNIVLPAQNASNAMLDANGDLKFFIVDNNIYDGVGGLIGNIKDFYNANNPYPRTCLSVSSTSEIMIIPDPSNCGRYYILTSTEKITDCIFQNPGYHASVPVFAVLDFNVPHPSNPNKFGAITSVEMLENLPSVNAQGIYHWTSDVEGGNLFSASKLKNDDDGNFRFVFVSLRNPSFGYGVLRFKLNSNGLVYDGFLPYDDQSNIEGSRSEMELVELANGNYRIAAPYGHFGIINGEEVVSAIYTADLDSDGEVVSGSVNTLYFKKNPLLQNDRPYIHGIEFSPDGSKLFISHTISDYHPTPFEYYDFDNPNPSDPNNNGIYPLNIGSNTVNEADFQNSHIELASDGAIYLGANQRLAKLTSPNTPLASNFTDNSVMVSGYVANYGISGNQYEMYKTYTLPDQIDGMIYENFAPTAYNEVIYTAQASGVWKPGTSNNPWGSSGEVYIKDKLIIPNDKDIIIQNMTFHFDPDAQVIVEQGAKLTIDNSTFTNSRPCNYEESYWQGIQVWGTSNQHQFPEANPDYQGLLVLKNGGTIEYAHHAVTNGRPGYWGEIGGVIQSTDGLFKNNRRDVSLMTYQNFLPGNPSYKVDDHSFFTNTDFISDDDFIEGHPRQDHVSMWDVNGIGFFNCHFANNITTGRESSDAPVNGIYALDASFIVEATCGSPYYPCPSWELNRSSFTGFKNAIKIAGAGITETATISQTDFTGNVSGVSVDEFNNVSINRNNFMIENTDYWSALYNSGIFLDNSTGFIVEENSVLGGPFFPANAHGITVNNSGTANNRLYKNTLDNISIGTRAERINHSWTNKTGLQFLCNNYIDNQTAIVSDFSGSTHGVRAYQGENSPVRAAGNTFLNNNLEIENNTGSITYYHDNNSIGQVPSATGFVNVILTNKSNACFSSYSPIIIFKNTAPVLDSLNIALEGLNSAYTDLYYNYTSLLDDGDTDLLQSKIKSNWSNDAWILRGSLMQKSPYLSDKALLTAAGENILPNAMLLEVLLANPDATRGADFIDKLNEVTNYSMPEYMLDYVRNNWDKETVRTTLEAKMASIKTETSTVINYIKYIEKSKNGHTYADRFKVVDMGEGISNKIGLMDFYIENKEWNKADSVLVAIENDKDMQEDLDLVKGFDNYIAFRSGLNDRNIAQLDSSEVIYLQTLAGKETRASGYAENILCFFYDICYDKELSDGKNVTKTRIIPSGDESTLEELFYNITVYPNPASDFSSIKWEILDELNNAQYKIIDLNGREMKTGPIENNKGEKVIDTRDLTNGLYLINIYNDGKMKMNAKLVVNKRK